MNSEAIRNIRTMRQVKNSLDIARNQNIKTTNHLLKTKEEMEQSTDGRQTGQVLAKERARYARYDASVEKSRQRLLIARNKLAAIINRNRALTRLRHELQQARWQRTDATLQEKPLEESRTGIAIQTKSLKKRRDSKHRRLHRIELKY